MGGGFGAALQFVDMDDLNLGVIERGAQRQAPHASKAVDANAYRHGRCCLHHAARFNLPISVTQRSSAKRSRVSIGRALKILIRCSSSVQTLTNAFRVAALVPTSAAGSSMPQCALIGWPGHVGQNSAAARSQRVKTKSSGGLSGRANSCQSLLRNSAVSYFSS